MTEDQPDLDQEQTAVEDEQAAEEQDETAKLKEAIDVQVQDVGTLRKKLTITIPRDAIDERLGEQYDELKRDSTVPGFRRGHAPLRLIQKRFRSEVGDQLISRLVTSGFLAAVEKVDIKPLGDPLIWIEEDGRTEGEKLVSLDQALAVLTLPAEGDLTYACEVEIRPEFDLPDLDAILINKPIVEISDDDVDTEISRYRALRGRYVPVADGPVEQDDIVVVDIAMTVDGQVVKEERNATLAARAQVIEGVVVEDLGEELAGKNAGDTVTLEATVGEDHPNGDYRGKTACFSITIHDIKRIEVPPLDQDLLDTLGMDSEDELRDHTRSNLVAQLDSVIRRGMRGQIGKFLLENVDLEVPGGLSQRQTDRLVGRRKVELYQQGVPEQEIEKRMDQLRAKATEDSISELKLFFIMEAIAEEMKIEVHDDELNAAIAGIASRQGMRFDRVRDKLSQGEGLMSLYLQLRDHKILDLLLEKAVITEIEGPKKKKTAKKKTAKKSVQKTSQKPAGATSEQGASGEKPPPKPKTALRKATQKKAKP